MISSFKDIRDGELTRCGGKGASLVRMIRMGLPVPEGYVIMPGTGEDEIRRFADGLSDDHTYAVRSSALNEDGDRASFAGAYETFTDVQKKDVPEAVSNVVRSADSDRVINYAKEVNKDNSNIAVVVQRFVKPDFAGVVFTSDIITGSSAHMTGNLVRGEGELLVSGEADADAFEFDNFKYGYKGPEDFGRYAKKLYKLCVKVREEYGRPMDIEWAVSGGKVYMLQARPVTTLGRMNEDTFEINTTYSNEFLLTRTNVGEIFMRPVSPVTFSILEIICGRLCLPGFIDYIEGQAYMNLSVICSLMIALGFSRDKAYSKIEDLAGKLPDGVEVPVFPMKRGKFIRNLIGLIRPKSKKYTKGYTMADHGKIYDLISGADSSEALADLFYDELVPFINGSLGEIVKGVNVAPLFGTASKIEEICGKELAGRIMAGSLGIIDSMKPMLLLEDVIDGKMSREDYRRACGHRHANEMELAIPYPYEDPSFPDKLIEEHIASGINVHKMKADQEAEYAKALEEFRNRYPGKTAKLNKLIGKYIAANEDREKVRSEGVKIFVALRRYLIKAGDITGTGDDIFMLYIDEVIRLLRGDRSVLTYVNARRETYKRYNSNPPFPNLIKGRFDPSSWMADPDRRNDLYGMEPDAGGGSDVSGFPGASGVVTGTARVICDISEAGSLKEGEILVTSATNIGWTVIFPRAAAVVTDIGAPLSHAAIVAREFGIPAVVGCGNATTLIHTGDRICVNGASGKVDIIR